MAKCPKCTERLNFWKTVSLTKSANRILCNSCQTVLEANKSALGSFGAVFAAVFIVLFQSFQDRFFQNPLIFSGIVFILIVGVFILFFYQVKLRVSQDQDKTGLTEKYEKKERPRLPEKFTRIDYLKNRFYDKTDSELEYIRTDPRRVPEAHQAAKELLKERKTLPNNT